MPLLRYLTFCPVIVSVALANHYHGSDLEMYLGFDNRLQTAAPMPRDTAQGAARSLILYQTIGLAGSDVLNRLVL